MLEFISYISLPCHEHRIRYEIRNIIFIPLFCHIILLIYWYKWMVHYAFMHMIYLIWFGKKIYIIKALETRWITCNSAKLIHLYSTSIFKYRFWIHVYARCEKRYLYRKETEKWERNIFIFEWALSSKIAYHLPQTFSH